MRDPSGPRIHSVLTWLMVAIGAAFVVQHIVALSAPGRLFIAEYVAATTGGLAHGRIWTLLTYGFLHSQNILHILFNLLGLFLLGRIVLPIMGSRRFLGFVAGCLVVSALVWYIVSAAAGLNSALIGVSGVCFGLFAVFATLFPDQQISFLLIPISVKPKHAAWAMAGISFFCMVVFELFSSQSQGEGYAHSAHLGGMLAGWLYGRHIHHRTSEFALRPTIELPAWLRRRKRAAAVRAPEYTVNVPSQPTDMKAEVDRILDKINSQGFGSLTDEERRVLDEARDTLNKR